MAAAARVLVVDDDAMMLASVSRMLSRQGYEVLPVSGPRQALEIVRTPRRVQLILSDVAMPEMRGTQRVSEVLRLSPQTAGLLMTGDLASLPDVPQGVAVIRKPFSTQELILAVRSTLAQSTELRAESRELCEQNKQLRSELKEEAQKSIETLKRLSDTRR
jgi:DNA-binding NtrC family response regulator